MQDPDLPRAGVELACLHGANHVKWLAREWGAMHSRLGVGMRAKKHTRITVQIGRSENGWFVATSDDLPGLFVANPTFEEVKSHLPEAIELIYQVRFQHSVSAHIVDLPQPLMVPGNLPVEILSQPRAR